MRWHLGKGTVDRAGLSVGVAFAVESEGQEGVHAKQRTRVQSTAIRR